MKMFNWILELCNCVFYFLVFLMWCVLSIPGFFYLSIAWLFKKVPWVFVWWLTVGVFINTTIGWALGPLWAVLFAILSALFAKNQPEGEWKETSSGGVPYWDAKLEGWKPYPVWLEAIRLGIIYVGLIFLGILFSIAHC